MSVNTYRPKDLATQRKIVSDTKNNTDDLTFDKSDKISSHGESYAKHRELDDDTEAKKLEIDVNSKDYYDELMVDD